MKLEMKFKSQLIVRMATYDASLNPSSLEFTIGSGSVTITPTTNTVRFDGTTSNPVSLLNIDRISAVTKSNLTLSTTEGSIVINSGSLTASPTTSGIVGSIFDIRPHTYTNNINISYVSNFVFNSIGQSSLNSIYPTTFGTVSNLYINDSPVVVGTNAFISNSYSLWNVGSSRFEGIITANNISVNTLNIVGPLNVTSLATLNNLSVTTLTVSGPATFTGPVIGVNTGSGSAPGGSNTQLQYNANGTFGGTSITWTSSNNNTNISGTLGVTSLATFGPISVTSETVGLLSVTTLTVSGPAIFTGPVIGVNTGGGSGSSPGGSNTQLQYNANGTFGGTSITWTSTNNNTNISGTLGVTSLATFGPISVTSATIGLLSVTTLTVSGPTIFTGPVIGVNTGSGGGTPGGTPGGIDREVQFNANGTFGGTSMTWTTSTNTLQVIGISVTSLTGGAANPSSSIQFNTGGSFGGTSQYTFNGNDTVILGSLTTISNTTRTTITNPNPLSLVNSGYSIQPSTTGSILNIESQTLTDNSNLSTTSIATFVSIQRPTLSATTPVITSSASTLYIAGAPISGTNETINEQYALQVAQGDSTFAGRVLATGNIVGSSQISGSTLTDGTLSINSGSITNAQGITVSTLTATRIINGATIMTTGLITGLNPPVNNTDATNKAYVDSVAVGLSFKASCHMATLTNITLSGNFTIDGVAAVNGDRVLVKNQTNGVENGIYVVATGAWSRSTDMAVGANAAGNAVLIVGGNTQSNTGWVCNNEGGSDIVGTNVLTFVQFSGTGTIVAGTALSYSGNTLNVNVDGTTITTSGNNLTIASGGVGSTQLATNSVTTAKITDGNVTNAKLANSSVTINSGSGLQNGGTVALGASLTLSVNSTVLRTTGDQSASGVQSFTNTTQSTDSTTGSVVISGGLGIAKDLFSVGRIDTTGIIEGGTLTDGILSATTGAVSGAVSIGTGSLTATGIVTGSTITTGTATIIGGNITGLVNITGSGTATMVSFTDGTATLSGGTLSGLIPPTAGSDAANKTYVDSVAQGIIWHDPVQIATTTAGTLATSFQIGNVIDSTTLASGWRILIKNQINQVQNGIYVVTVGPPPRASDLSTGSAENAACLVEQGSVNIGSSWVVTGDPPYTIGTDNMVWTQFSSSGSVNAGIGLTKTGNTLDVNYDDSTIGIISNNLYVKAGGITATQLASNSVTTVKILDGNVTNAKLANSSYTVTAGDGLQTGGTAQLGSSVTLAVNSTVLRTSGNQSASGIQSFTNTTQSTDSTTGAVVISGGLGIAKDLFSVGRIDTTGIIEGGTLTDGVLSVTTGAISSAVSIGTGSLNASGTITGNNITDGISTMSGGILTTSRGIAQALMRLSYIPTNMVLFTGANGDISFTSNFMWNGSLLTASLFDTQNITRPNDPNTASLWSDGIGNIDIGLQSTGTIQLGLGPTLELTQTSSTLKSELTIQSNFSRQYTISAITSAANVTYTASQCFGGIIARDPNGADRTDTFPTAAQFVAAVPNSVVGSSIEVLIRNTTTGLFLITLVGGTGVTILGTASVAPGLTSRILIIFTNVGSGTEAVTVFLAVPKDRITLQGSFTNPTSGASTVTWMNWGPTLAATVVDSMVLGYSGVIVQLVCAYSNTAANPIGIVPGQSLSFSIGTSNATLTTFTAYSGGTNVVIFDSTDNGTFPRKSSGALNIPFLSTDRLAIESTEVGTVTPTAGNAIRCVLTIELD